MLHDTRTETEELLGRGMEMETHATPTAKTREQVATFFGRGKTKQEFRLRHRRACHSFILLSLAHEVSGYVTSPKLFHQFLLTVSVEGKHVSDLENDSLKDQFSEVVDRTHVLASDKFQIGVIVLSLAQMLEHISGRGKVGQAQIREWAEMVKGKKYLDFMGQNEQIGGHIALQCLHTFQVKV